MLFFRSEELIDAWCQARGVPRRQTVRMDQLWQLAHSWYSTRLQPDARRPGPEEMRQIFAAIGLVGDFWDSQSDKFG